MSEGQEQTGGSWEDLPLPDEYPEPHMENKAALNREEEEDASATTTEEGVKDQSAKCSPNLLQMLKAAESKWTPQGQHEDGAESETGEQVTEAWKTDMVSKDTDRDISYNTCICKHFPQEV